MARKSGSTAAPRRRAAAAARSAIPEPVPAAAPEVAAQATHTPADMSDRAVEEALREGERVKALLDSAPGVRIRRLHGNEARRIELLRCFQSGEFDVVHYAGHAFFDPEHRTCSGILCAGREILSGADLASLSRLPALVFFNACEAARVRRVGDGEASATEVARGPVGFAESFLAGGVANYLGTYWPVNDNGAEAFAGAFYAALLRGEALGPALIAGRRAVRKLNLGDWANYVLYGNPDFILTLATAR
jgi:CHAT domain-containing protein